MLMLNILERQSPSDGAEMKLNAMSEWQHETRGILSQLSVHYYHGKHSSTPMLRHSFTASPLGETFQLKHLFDMDVYWFVITRLGSNTWQRPRRNRLKPARSNLRRVNSTLCDEENWLCHLHGPFFELVAIPSTKRKAMNSLRVFQVVQSAHRLTPRLSWKIIGRL